MVISFDLHATLIKSNPAFKLARNEFVKDMTGVSDSVINDAFKAIKYRYDSVIEIYGTAPNNLHVHADICNLLGIKDLNAFRQKYFDTWMRNSPILYQEDTLDLLMAIKDKGHELIVSSNTLFIPGHVLGMSVDILGIDEPLISKFSYSDVVGLSKPHAAMFSHRADWHLGDNIKTDGAATSHGIKFYQINSNDKTLKDFYAEIINVDVLTPQVQV